MLRSPLPASRKLRVLLALVALAALLAALFDWNWCRPLVERYLSKHSRREVRADHMAVSGILTLEPTVTFRNAYVGNAPWADARQPMAVAGEVSFTFSLRSVVDDRTIISRIVLKDADVDLEKRADGLRNWRLKNPDDPGPAKVRVLRLEARNSKLRFADRTKERDFDIRFAAEDAPAQAQSKPQLANSIAARGTYRGANFEARVLTGPVLSFRETGEFFDVRGAAAAGGTRLEIDGRAADIFARPLLDAQVRVAGRSLSELHPFILLRPAHSRPFSFEARVKRDSGEFRFDRLHGRIGDTDLAGEGSHLLEDERHLWRATLGSASADVADLAALVGVDEPAQRRDAAPNRLFPAAAIKADRLRSQDVRLRYEARKLKASGMKPLESLRFDASLAGGLLEVMSLDAGIGGGRASGRLTLDARSTPIKAHGAVKFSGLDLERLFPMLPGEARNTGPLRGSAELAGSGDSIAAILGGAAGRIEIALDGGTLSNKLDAKLSLNLGKLTALFFKGDHAIPIYCALAGIDFHAGNGKVRTLLLETEQTRIEGSGAVSLRDEKPDLLLVPRAKNPGLFTLGSTIHVGGTLKHPTFDFHRGATPGIASAAHCPPRGASVAAAR